MEFENVWKYYNIKYSSNSDNRFNKKKLLSLQNNTIKIFLFYKRTYCYSLKLLLPNTFIYNSLRFSKLTVVDIII